ncbi:beta-phosphoglucomutase [Aliifodinibius salipaludis]|uniref:Beta-phosphoglucomutase n=1 Tax=Fodinibius salipaludis TaxID=2032627 RepID=A0A2A2GE36_9BACT|nr:beta-phosphoglucomutase [Aliifodinibius salipaludis]PAU95628.1 beta-phosphoglucomutase [Aliifodinibius salipaludis]
MVKVDACIFDLDGVIVETSDAHFKAWQRLAKSLGISFGEEFNEQLKGVSRRKSIEKILALDDRELPEEEIQQLMDKKNGWYQDAIAELTPDDILEGVPSFIESLQGMNIPLGIGSSSKNAPYIIDYLQLNDTFEVIIDGTKVENTKPDPEVFLKGVKAMNADPSKTIVFEDAVSGVEAANNGGFMSVGVGSEEYLGDADLVVPNFIGLTPKELFEKLSDE